MRVLHLTLKKQWFDMILSGEKREEYREIKPYWTKRLKDFLVRKPFDVVEFKNGYSKNAPTMLVNLKSISFGESKPEWSDGPQECYVLELGEIIKTSNIQPF